MPGPPSRRKRRELTEARDQPADAAPHLGTLLSFDDHSSGGPCLMATRYAWLLGMRGDPPSPQWGMRSSPKKALSCWRSLSRSVSETEDSKRLVRASCAVTCVSSAGECARAPPITLTATTDIPIANLINRMVISQIG